MALRDEQLRKNKEILKALNDAINSGPWEHNLFFRGIGKKLRDLRDRFQQELGLTDNEHDAQQDTIDMEKEKKITDVYILLYQAEGNNLHRWTAVVNALAGHSINRPVYKNEADVRAAIRAKEYKHNDAYVTVRVDVEDILSPPDNKPLLDRFGHELLLLKEDAVKLHHIQCFIHANGHYRLEKGVLVKINETDKKI